MNQTSRIRGVVGAALALTLFAAGCGDDDDTSDATTTSSMTSTSAAADTSSTSTSTPMELSQPAIWPAPDVVFSTPEEAAADFVENVLGVPPELGEFMPGDSRSGEIEVFSPREGDAGEAVARGVLLMRQIGPTDGWYVIGAANENASIESPETLATVPAGSLTVEGVARGFEANVVVTAFVAGNSDSVLDEEITMGGAFETPEPYSVTLDLTAALPGDVVAILVRGGTGLETDPGEFGAIAVVIG